MGVSWRLVRYLMSRALVVVLPVPPLPAMAITFGVIFLKCLGEEVEKNVNGRPSVFISLKPLIINSLFLNSLFVNFLPVAAI
ncbi:MAG: hypothetical protein C0613_07120 [Desulfobulbaceae bacterium]|nr:MAG: hypothetical protein C0613_07120 [Desulfobulbaceae bacterium]